MMGEVRLRYFLGGGCGGRGGGAAAAAIEDGGGIGGMATETAAFGKLWCGPLGRVLLVIGGFSIVTYSEVHISLQDVV